MPFRKGREKTGGRKLNTGNKITSDLRALLDELGCNPIEGMGRIAVDQKIDIAIRLRAHAELAKYLHPQLKAIEHSGSIKTGSDGGSESPAERILRDLAEASTGEPAPSSGQSDDPAGAAGLLPDMGLPGATKPETTGNP
jgi:hypothetical protein